MKAPRLLATLVVALAPMALACHEVHLDFSKAESSMIALFDDLYSISVVDGEYAVAVGYWGAAYYTEDGGTSWKRGRTGTRTSLYKVSMADRQHGWAVGQRGLVIRTEDGGRTWHEQAHMKKASSPHLFGVSAINADTAWVIGEWGTRIITTDGGKTWTDHSFTIDEFHPMFVWLTPAEQKRVRAGEAVFEDVSLNDISCQRTADAGTARCWLIGEFGYIFSSNDGGMNWTQSTIEGSATMPLIELPYNEIEISKAAFGPIQDFAAEVATEAHLNVAIAAVASEREIQDFGRGDDPTELFEILEARAQDVRSALENAGVSTDRIRLRAQPPWDYEDFLEDDPEFLNRYLASRSAEVGGVQVSVIQNPILFTVRFEDDDRGLIAGLGGVILRSDDGGVTWEYRKMDQTLAVFSVAGVNGRMLAVGEKGFVRFSPDDGDTWAQPADDAFPNIFTFMRDVAFDPEGRVGFIVGQTGQILRSTDAGHRWTQVLPPPDADA